MSAATASGGRKERYEIRLSGSGGQGIVLAAVILAEAAAMNPRNYVCQTQAYGPESRGGKCRAEVVVSRGPIDYPMATRPDLLLAMNQESCDAYFFRCQPGGILVADSTFVEQIPTERVVAIAFTRLARERFGRELPANIMALGALAVLCPIVSRRHLEEAVSRRSPDAAREMNMHAFRAGVEAASAIDLAQLPAALFPGGDEEE